MSSTIKEKGPHTLPLARKIRYGQLLGGAVVLVVLGNLANLLATNENMQWDVVWKYFLGIDLVNGLVLTLQLTLFAMLIGLVLGATLALMRMSSNPLISGVSGLYIWFFRGTPLLVQIIFWFNISLLFPKIEIGIPFGGPTFYSGNTNDLVTPVLAGLLALSLNEGAYMAEIVRAGILSVAPGQLEAAQTIGLSRFATTTRIILPQAMRVIIPPTGNQLIGMLKTTSLVSVIAVPELLYSAQLIYSKTYETVPLLVAASIWYLIVSTILSYFQGHIERHYGRGTRAQAPRSGQRLIAALTGRRPRKTPRSSTPDLELGIGEDGR
ncbi:amino acid ABC transporter permease [Paenarthrobacter nitroguajacolicus]